jgi:RNA:NAD 2'-phosphotransferase (TPT1/KptA family)
MHGDTMENNSKRSRDDLIRLSRTVSHALRHAPEEYGIQLDGSGWIEIAELLKALQDKSKHWNDLAAEDLHLMASAGEKPRYEFEGSRIRAAYGHSISAPIQYEESVPLYETTICTSFRRCGYGRQGRTSSNIESRDSGSRRKSGLRFRH